MSDILKECCCDEGLLDYVRDSLVVDTTQKPPVIGIKNLVLAALANEGLDWAPGSDTPPDNVWHDLNGLPETGQFPATMTLPTAAMVIRGLQEMGETPVDPESVRLRLKVLDASIQPTPQELDRNSLIALVRPLQHVISELAATPLGK